MNCVNATRQPLQETLKLHYRQGQLVNNLPANKLAKLFVFSLQLISLSLYKTGSFRFRNLQRSSTSIAVAPDT